MKTDLFDYTLPESLIAKYPPKQRDGGRLLHLQPETQTIGHHQITALPSLLPKGALIVANNSRVFPARLFATKPTGGKVEVLLVRLEQSDDNSCQWRALCKSNRPIRIGDTLDIHGVTATVCEIGERGEKLLTIDANATIFKEKVDAMGSIPLPPYIKREADDDDKERYQTVFAQEDGSVAAPTAGLHLTPELMQQSRVMGHDFAFVTLHVGPGTFRPINTNDLTSHIMDVEFYTISEEVAEKINTAKSEGCPIIAVGTTVVRTLEACARDRGGRLIPGQYSTDIFIYPPYAFNIVDGLLTNFHLPKSTLLCLVSALGGREFVLKAYREAVKAQYRFYSYGDAMLITP